MVHSHIFPFLVYNVVKLLFYTSFYWKWQSKFSRFCKMPRRYKVVGSRWIKLFSLRHIGHSPSHTRNGYFKLMVALLWIHSGFFSHSLNIVGHAITHTRSRGLEAWSVLLDLTSREQKWTKNASNRVHYFKSKQTPLPQQNWQKLYSLKWIYFAKTAEKNACTLIKLA